MSTNAKRIILNASALMILIFTALLIYGNGRETTTANIADIAYTCYGTFQWSTINWFYVLKAIFIVSLPFFPWLYWAMRKFPFKFNTFRTVLAVSCSIHCILVLFYFARIAFADSIPDYEMSSTPIPTVTIAATSIWVLSAILNYAFSILYFLYKITRSILSRIYPHIKKH